MNDIWVTVSDGHENHTIVFRVPEYVSSKELENTLGQYLDEKRENGDIGDMYDFLDYVCDSKADGWSWQENQKPEFIFNFTQNIF